MHLTTDLPLAAMFFKHWDTDDTEVGVVVAKARFLRGGDGNFWVTDAPELVLAEVFASDPATTPLLADQDIAPGKAATDLLIHAIARAPGGNALGDWPVTVSVPDRLTYGFQVRGPTRWEKHREAWRQSKPEPLTELPLSYALAYGGQAPGDDAPESHDFNPAGLGFATPRLLKDGNPFPAAQIGDLADFMATDPLATWTVHGLGPIAKAWLPRRGHAGTFDAQWHRTRHPRMPHDYSYRFWNAAPARLQFAEGLLGHETITVSGVSLDGMTHVQLPGAQLVLFCGSDQPLAMPLDTVEADIRAADPAEHSCC
jgi:hypothetical protein